MTWRSWPCRSATTNRTWPPCRSSSSKSLTFKTKSAKSTPTKTCSLELKVLSLRWSRLWRHSDPTQSSGSSTVSLKVSGTKCCSSQSRASRQKSPTDFQASIWKMHRSCKETWKGRHMRWQWLKTTSKKLKTSSKSYPYWEPSATRGSKKGIGTKSSRLLTRNSTTEALIYRRFWTWECNNTWWRWKKYAKLQAKSCCLKGIYKKCKTNEKG